jgi:CobQ-like glutamine amidotransferase family enzyme
MSSKPIRIINLLPELLGTYGDQGNAATLSWRLTMRGIANELLHASAYEKLPNDGDFYLLGGGEDDAQIAAVELLRNQKTLQNALDNGAQVFAVCAGFQLLGESFPASGGRTIAGLSLLPIKTESVKERSVGELLLNSTIGIGELTGFENHAGQTRFTEKLQPLGTVVAGIGNHQSEASDGAVTEQILATYMHGPALVRNPELADYLLQRKLGKLPLFTANSARQEQVFKDLHASCVARASR